MKKTHLIRINKKDYKWLDVYDPDFGYEWTILRSQACVMTKHSAEIRLTAVRRQFPDAIIEPR